MTTNAPGGFDLAAALASLPANNSQQGNTVPGQPGISSAEQNYNYQVYLGTQPVTKQFNPNAGGRLMDNEIESYRGTADKTSSLDQAMQMLYDPTQGRQIMQQLYKLGLIDTPTDMQSAESLWSNAIQMAGRFYTLSGGKNKLSPWDVLNSLAGSQNAAKAKQNQPYTHTSTSTNVTKFTAEDAKGYATQAYQQFLGRDPSAKEQSAIASVLSKYAASNPSVTHTTVHGDGKGNETSSSTSSGGVSAAGINQELRDQAQADPGYGAYIASTTYMNALQSLLGAGA